MRTRLLVFSLITGLSPALLPGQTTQHPRADTRCAPDNGGITLPKGFCASIFADSLASPRHLTVAPNGDVFVALASGGVMALRDRNGDGVADERNKFGDGHGSEVALFDGYLYAENGSDILRYRLPAGSLAPTGEAEKIVVGLPTGGTVRRPLPLLATARSMSTSALAPTPARARTESSRSPASIPARSSRRAPASGDSTRASSTRRRLRVSISPAESGIRSR